MSRTRTNLTYGYDIGKLANDMQWWDTAWECCNPDEHIGHVLREVSPNTSVRGVHNGAGRLLLVASFHESDGATASVEIQQLPDVKEMNMELLCAASMLGFNLDGQRPMWRLSTRARA